MHTLFKALALTPILLVPPVMAQDFLQGLENLVDDLTSPPPRTAPRPTAPESEAPEVAPVPRPRPPDRPVVPEPTPPAVEEEEEMPPPPAVEEEEPEVVAEPEPEPVAPPEPAGAPARVYQVACPAVIQGLVEAEMAPPLSDGICGEQSPLVVTAVLSRGRMVPLSSPVTTNCQMASALPDWVASVDGYAEAMLESRIASVDTGTSYMCRARNGGDEGFTSEHGFANAVDVTGFTLENGQTIGVEADWDKATAPEGRLLRLAHDAACGSFMTTLGPEANAEHEDHLHLDLGCHGEACQARICE
ncbi:MAG: extensin family protein [Candidatus Devosia phytovorans]|uniref:Extensin family protein n=1 Tax=Candidatus Devosia phytovorans TaxID=3121372 RepID=A0AAJ5VUY5_9HYPH|nr:extensin family protein [Devosia sp.]WEK04052.1 MAG: extensin family protein [Devosia sp.]